MKILKTLVRSVINSLRSKPLTEDQQSQLIVNRIRRGGGKVGDNVDILSSVIDLGEPYLISIGNNVTLTTMRLLTHDASTKKSLGYTKIGRVTIGDDVFVGAGSIILPDTQIGSRVIIGAGSVVAHNIPSNSVACGSPCRVICSYDEYIDKMKKRMEKYSCYDLLPIELMEDEHVQERDKIILNGYGFIM